mmetsp:Transcript_28365/g.71231  ORF Transcript_28365/g.71231 Transcript_28365/m.71231 type:complete len:341 (-) Transcript_28365:758-1780(-)
MGEGAMRSETAISVRENTLASGNFRRPALSGGWVDAVHDQPQLRLCAVPDCAQCRQAQEARGARDGRGAIDADGVEPEPERCSPVPTHESRVRVHAPDAVVVEEDAVCDTAVVREGDRRLKERGPLRVETVSLGPEGSLDGLADIIELVEEGPIPEHRIVQGVLARTDLLRVLQGTHEPIPDKVPIQLVVTLARVGEVAGLERRLLLDAMWPETADFLERMDSGIRHGCEGLDAESLAPLGEALRILHGEVDERHAIGVEGSIENTHDDSSMAIHRPTEHATRLQGAPPRAGAIRHDGVRHPSEETQEIPIIEFLGFILGQLELESLVEVQRLAAVIPVE